jgi:hypothetical protein
VFGFDTVTPWKVMTHSNMWGVFQGRKKDASYRAVNKKCETTLEDDCDNLTHLNT